MASAPPPRRVPSIAGYVLAGVLALAGIVLGVVLIVSGIRTYIDKVEGFERFSAPGTHEVRLDDGGYSIYFEQPGLDREDSLPRMSVAVTAPDGSPVALERYGSEVTYSVSGHDGRGAFTFRAEEPGDYRMQADGSSGEVAVGRGIGARFAGAVVAGVATILLAPVLGAIAAIITFLRRSNAKRANAAAVTGWS